MMLEPFQSLKKAVEKAVEAPARPLQALQVKHKYEIGVCHARMLLCACGEPVSAVLSSKENVLVWKCR